MKKIDLGQSVTILANIGVIGGIILLAYELRQNNENLEVQTSLAILELDNELNEMPLVYPEIYRALMKRSRGEELTEPEEAALRVFLSRGIRNLEWRYLNSPESAIRFSSAFEVSRGTGPWEEMRDSLDPAFVEWVESEIFVD